MLYCLLPVFILGAAVSDVLRHRLPNVYLLAGFALAIVMQVSLLGWQGAFDGGAGLLTGFAAFLPFYIMRGMAAGDVKLMAVVGSYLGSSGALWAAACSLMLGSILGLLYLLYFRGLGKFLGRYWAMTALRSHIPAEAEDPARHRFPYAIAIASGTLLSLYWAPF